MNDFRLMIAEKAIIDHRKGFLSLINILDKIKVKKYPFGLQFSLALQINSIKNIQKLKEMEYEFSFYTIPEKAMENSGKTKEDKLIVNPGGDSIRLLIDFAGLFSQECELFFKIYIKEIDITIEKKILEIKNA